MGDLKGILIQSESVNHFVFFLQRSSSSWSEASELDQFLKLRAIVEQLQRLHGLWLETQWEHGLALLLTHFLICQLLRQLQFHQLGCSESSASHSLGLAKPSSELSSWNTLGSISTSPSILTPDGFVYWQGTCISKFVRIRNCISFLGKLMDSMNSTEGIWTCKDVAIDPVMIFPPMANPKLGFLSGVTFALDEIFLGN